MNEEWIQSKARACLAAGKASGWCGVIDTEFADGMALRTRRGPGWFNEVLVVLLAAIVVLVVVKPF